MRNRPVVVSAVAAFLFAATVIAAIVGTSLLFPGTFLDQVWKLNQPAYAAFHAFQRTVGILLLIVGILASAAAVGLLRGDNRAWWLAIAIFTLDGLSDLVNLLMTGDLKGGSGALIAVAFLFYLSRPNVTAFFKNPADA